VVELRVIEETRVAPSTCGIDLDAAALATSMGSRSPRTARRRRAHTFCCAVPNFRHIEYFHDHIRVERELFDGVLEQESGALRPDRSRVRHGLELKA